MLDVEVIENPEVATAALAPVRSRLLAELAEPASAASLAERMGISRQKINYHLKALERHKLIEAAGTRKWGGLTERMLVASARSYVLSPETMGQAASDPDRTTDRLSASYAIALGARIVREVGGLWRKARETDKRLATLSINTEITFRSPADRAAFTRELTEAVAAIAARFHDDTAPEGRRHRLVVVAHPTLNDDTGKDASCQ